MEFLINTLLLYMTHKLNYENYSLTLSFNRCVLDWFSSDKKRENV